MAETPKITVDQVKERLESRRSPDEIRGPHFNMILKLAQLEKEMRLTEEEVALGQCLHDTITTEQVLRFAHRVRPALTAPKEWHPPMPMLAFLPPAPVPENMWIGALGTHGQDDRILPPSSSGS